MGPSSILQYPHVLQVLLRCSATVLAEWALESSSTLLKLGDLLSRFAFIDTVVLELKTSDSPPGDSVEAFIGALQYGDGVEVQLRTCVESHKLHLDTKKEGAPPGSVRPFSPFWCSTLHRDTRKTW